MYETIGWHYVRGYREVTYGLVIVPILLLSLINFVVGLVLTWIVLERTPKKFDAPPRLRSAAPAVSASFLASSAVVALSLLVMPVLGPALNHRHLLYTPLTEAAVYQDDTLVISKVLAGENPNVKAPGRGATPLHYMAGGNKLAAVKVLLENGAKPNERDPAGKTPLHWAVKGCVDTAIVKMLLDEGASPVFKDKEGKTPLDDVKTIPEPSQSAIRTVMLKGRKELFLIHPPGESPKVPMPQSK